MKSTIKQSLADRIYELLKRKGKYGATNKELNRICLRYSARIHELRQSGLHIVSKAMKSGEYRFYLIGEEGVAA